MYGSVAYDTRPGKAVSLFYKAYEPTLGIVTWIFELTLFYINYDVLDLEEDGH